MIRQEFLDVTKIEPRQKHPLIFQYFDDLEDGEAFVISNNHDPKPLYYQMLGERGNTFTWDYLEKGPSWQVKIGKKTAREKADTVGEIAAKDMRKAEAFRRMGIDFCCGGNQTLKEAGEQAGLTEEQVQRALDQAEKSAPAPSLDFYQWELDFLADFIVNTHHRYITENNAIILELAKKVAQKHAQHHPELKRLAETLARFLQDILNHLIKEERVLFPGIKALVAAGRNPQLRISLPARLISDAIRMMQTEHSKSGEDLKFFRKITDDYTPPADACNSYSYLLEKLKEFEADLLQHIHLENNILFPKAASLEKKLIADISRSNQGAGENNSSL